MNWRVTLAIAQKDIVDAVKNLYLLFSLVLPIGISLLFRLVFPGPDELGTLTIAVYDPGGSRLVAALREMFQVRLLEVTSDQQLAEGVEKKAVGGLAVPAGFDAAVEAGEQPELTVYLNRRRTGYERIAFKRLVEQQVWALVEQPPPVRITWADVASPVGSQAGGKFRLDHLLLIIYLVMAVAMAGVFVVPTLLVEEKEKHTLDALLMSPADTAEVVAGKALTGLLYSLLIAGALLVLNPGWAGDWPVTLLAVLLGSLFMVAVGLLMGSLFRTTMQVNTWSSIFMLALMSPSWFLMLDLPTSLETAFCLIPTHYLADALELALAGEAALAQVWGDLAVLAGSVIVAFAAVVWTLRRQER